MSDRESQIEQLNRFLDINPDAREMKRALAVKLALQGYAYRAISEIVNVSPSFVTKWKNNFQKRGIKGLKLAYKGACPKLSDTEKEEVIKWLLCQEYWDVWDLETHLAEEYDVVFESKESYYKILRKARLSRQQAKPVNTRKDPEKIKERNQEIQKILADSKLEIEAGKLVVYAIDECHLVGLDLCGEIWGRIKERAEIPVSNLKDRQTYYGALNLFEPEFILEEYSAGNGENTVDFVGKLKAKHPQQRLLLFWDGVSYHRCQKMKEFLASQNQNLSSDEWNITCQLFAPYAPEENPVEAIWLQLKTLLRRLYRFGKSFKIMNLLFQLFADLKLFNFPDLKKFEAFS